MSAEVERELKSIENSFQDAYGQLHKILERLGPTIPLDRLAALYRSLLNHNVYRVLQGPSEHFYALFYKATESRFIPKVTIKKVRRKPPGHYSRITGHLIEIPGFLQEFVWLSSIPRKPAPEELRHPEDWFLTYLNMQVLWYPKETPKPEPIAWRDLKDPPEMCTLEESIQLLARTRQQQVHAWKHSKWVSSAIRG